MQSEGLASEFWSVLYPTHALFSTAETENPAQVTIANTHKLLQPSPVSSCETLFSELCSKQQNSRAPHFTQSPREASCHTLLI